MAKKKIKGTRILAAILTAAMVFTSTPYTALAAESEAGYVTVQNEIEQTGQADDGTGNNGNNGENGGKGNNGAGDFSDGSDKDGGNSGTGDISDNNGGNGETGDVSGGNGGTGDVSGGSGRDVSGSDSEVSVSGNDIAVYGAAATATGTLTVEGNSGSYSYDAENDVITVKNGANLTFHSADGYGAENPSQTRIYVEKDAKATLTLDGVYINVSDKAVSPLEIAEDSTGAVSVVLKGSNALTAGEKAAGIQKNGTADGTLTISGSGALTAQGGKYGAGIGSGYEKAGSNISISGGEVTATGGYGGAGIGGGMYGAGSSITISGGMVTTTGGNGGAGIGSGYSRSASNITISGGTVIAKGGYNGAGIGGGKNGAGSNISISGGEVTATGGGYGAGIGGGYCGVGSNITISGGEVTATGGENGAGIGGGDSRDGNDITISGGTVTATGGGYGAGIGGGNWGSTGKVTITGGSVKTTKGVLTGVTNGTDEVYCTVVDLTEEFGIEAAVTDVGETAYGMKDVMTDADGKIYMYLPAGETSILLGMYYYTGTVSAEAGADNRLTRGKCRYDLLVLGDPAYYERNEIPQGILIKDGANLTVKSGNGYGKDNYSQTRIEIEKDASVTLTLDGTYIDTIDTTDSPILIPENSTGNVNIILKGENGLKAGRYYAAIQKDGDAENIGTLTISGDGALIAQGGKQGAGIGGGHEKAGNNIVISGGEVTATGGEYAAGIGGGKYGSGISITISGGTVTALSTADEAYREGAGIGSGCGTGISGPEIYGGNIKASRLSGVLGKEGKVYLARADLLLLAGKNAVVGNPVLQTYNKKTGETKTLSYNLKDVCTMEDGYLYMYLPADTEDTVTRLVFDNAVYEATVKKFDYGLEPGRYSDFTLISSTDGKAEYGEVLREDVPDDGIIPDGIWMSDLQAGGYTYTGKAITPSFRVYDGKKMLAVKKDYTVSYKNNIKAATADDAKKAPTITVKSTGNYKGTETRTFTINPASLDATEQRINIDNLYLAAPTGKNPKGIKAVPVVTDNGKKLSENRDYTVNHVTLNEQNAENKNANSYVTPGKYTVEITGKGNYTGTRQITVTLADVAKEQILMSKVTVAKVPDVTYDADLCEGRSAAGMTPALTVTYGSGKNKVTLYKEGDVNAAGETVSAENADYTVNWINNRYVGTATAVLTGTGKILEDGTASGTYFGEKRITFRIKGTALSASMVSWADGSKNVSVVYNGEEQEPRVRVSLQKKVKGKDGKMVTQTTYLREYNEYYKVGDYKVSYLKNVDAGTATVVITGAGGYTGTVKKTFKITQADLAAEGTEAKIGVADSIPFVKNGAKPAIVVTAKMANGNTVTLKEGKDYTVTYANNKAVSEGKNLTEKKLPLITVKGKGNFKGSIKQTFTITNKSLADKVNPITVTVTDVPANKNKGKFVSKPVVTDETGTKLKEKTDYTLTYSLLTENGAVELDTKTGIVNEPGSTVRITITGAGNYRGEGSVLTADYRITESDFKKVTVKVVPKTLPYTTKPVTLTEEDLILTMKVGTGKQAVVEELKLITDGDDTKDGYKIIGYKNNVNKGTAQVTLQGCGKYGGTKTVKFYIGTRPFLWWLRNV